MANSLQGGAKKGPLPLGSPGERPPESRWFRWMMLSLVAVTLFYFYHQVSLSAANLPQEISYSEFYRWLMTDSGPQRIRSAVRIEGMIRGETEGGARFTVNVPDNDPDLIRLVRERVPNFRVEAPRIWFGFLLNLAAPILLMLGLTLLLYRGAAQGGGRILSFGKSRARQITPEDGQRITFADVAGVKEAKEELQEVIEFLKDPRKFQRLGGKIPKGVLLLGPPGCGKCVTGDSLVATHKGLIEIRDIPKYFNVDLDNRVSGARVRTISLETDQPIWSEATHWFDLGEQPTVRMKTDLGLELEGTLEHPVVVMSEEGNLEFRRLEQLRVGDLAAVPYGWEAFGEREWVDPETAYLLGLLIGDGGLTIRNRISFTTQEPELLDFVKRYARERYGYEVVKARSKPYDYVLTHQPLRRDLLHCGLKETYADGKEVPEWVRLSSKPVVAAFLRGLFDTDGCAERGGVLVTLSSASRTLIRQVSQLLLSFGIVHTLQSRPKRYNGRLQYYVIVTGDFLEVFQREIGFGLERKRRKLADYLARTTRNPNRNVVPGQGRRLQKVWDFLVEKGGEPSRQADGLWLKNLYRYMDGSRRPSVPSFRNTVQRLEQLDPQVQTLTEFQALTTLTGAKLLFSRVKGLEASRARVYDFTVAESHSFIANGFINHNTLLAKAVAGQAGVPFFSISGSDFVEMFVGVGASRVRDLFEQAKKSAKASARGCIIFIDEIDAVGRQRFAGIGGGHDEREQTLNALLVEMDGFNTQEGVILVAASVTGDTPILIEERGIRQIVPIGDFVDRFYAPDEGDVERPVPDIRALGYLRKTGYSVYGNKFEAAAFQPVRGVYRHKVDHVYRIRYRGGEVRATGSHSVFISYHGGIRAVRVDQLEAGDVLVDLPYKVNRTTARRQLRALAPAGVSANGSRELVVIPGFHQWQQGYQYALSQKGKESQAAIARELGVSQTTISGWQRGVKRPRRLGRQDYKYPIPPFVPVTSELARLFGLLVAEGSLEPRRNRITFSFHSKEETLVHDVKQMMLSLFHVNSPIISHPEPTETCVSFKNRHLTRFLISQVGVGARGKHLPPFLYEAPRQIFLDFLKAYMEGDGYEDKAGRHIACTVNRSLATEFNWLCRMHGVKSTVREIDVPTRVVRGRTLSPTKAYLLEIGKRNWPWNNGPSFTRRAKVLSVRREPYDGYVYDLCGCGNEAFFGGVNPILLHNTNRPDVLDPALLRPGRFDRQIVVDRPDLVGREEILQVHVRKVKLAKEVELKSIARQTPGFSGADLANLCNEAALLAARNNKDAVGMKEMEAAIERVMAGPERKSRVISPYEKSVVACHEAGHALVSILVPGADPLHKVSIIPRGAAALGYTMQTPLEDRYLMTRNELLAKLTVLLGGRSAEELTFGEITTGAQNDLEVATDIARRMVCEYGMSDRLGSLTYGKREGMVFLGRDIVEERNYSDETAVAIDEEIRRIVQECHERAKGILSQHRERLKRLSDTLLEREVLDGDEAKRIVLAEESAPPAPPAAAESEPGITG